LRAGNWKVEVHSYTDRPRKVLVWRRGHLGWMFQQGMVIPEDVDAAVLETEVISRLPQ
jgi:hypothetical protein